MKIIIDVYWPFIKVVKKRKKIQNLEILKFVKPFD